VTGERQGKEDKGEKGRKQQRKTKKRLLSLYTSPCVPKRGFQIKEKKALKSKKEEMKEKEGRKIKRNKNRVVSRNNKKNSKKCAVFLRRNHIHCIHLLISQYKHFFSSKDN